MPKLARARDVAKWRSDNKIWIDHAVLVRDDLEWLRPVDRMTLWAVKVPPGILAELPHLRWLDLRGGSGESLAVAEGCSRLRYLQVNQVRGMRDLDLLSSLIDLELLSLYGLPKVERIPSLGALVSLRRAEIGMMRNLLGLTGLLEAPGLEELHLSKHVHLHPSDPDRIANHPSIKTFGWFAEDIPNSMWMPAIARVGKPGVRPMHAADWFAERE